MSVSALGPTLCDADYERLRDGVIIASRRLSHAQLLELVDGLHAMIRLRNPRSWEQARRGTSGFA